MGTEFWKHLRGKELKGAASQLSLAPPGSHNEENLTASNTTGMLSQSQMTPSAPAHLAVPILESSYGSMPSPRAPDPCLPLFPITPTGDGQKRVMDMTDARDQGNNSNGIPACHPTMLSLGWNNGGTSSHGIQRVIAPHLPTSAMSSMAGDGRHPTMAAVASTNNYGMNINGMSASTASWLAYLAWRFTQPNNSGMGPNGFMRAQAPHLAAFYMPATPGVRRQSAPASSVTGTAAPRLPVMQSATVNTILSLAPPHSVPAGAIVALDDLQIKMEHDGTYDDTAIPLAVGMPAAAAGAAATYATSIPAPAMMDTRDGRASAFNPWRPHGFNPVDGPSSSSRQAQELQGGSNQYRASAFYPWCPGFKPVDGSSSSRQAQELQGGSNQGEQGAKPLLDLFKP
ncbi:hypothetical protein SETIT_3G192700v2 [Setaria italica]|uniref:Uncharacterized protein n=1 Tax=Setaria italica TaxID=4555 RepID=A0A368QGU3_SETIT|nr:uncharacterized protein LOC101765643 [Setaria italica]RCV17102.1 hypothetical protein SETIT_3G192700v2 [Setaria italica]